MCEFGEYVKMFDYTKTKLPVFYNVNFGHFMPIGVLPYGVQTELDCENKTITLLESATIEIE